MSVEKLNDNQSLKINSEHLIPPTQTDELNFDRFANIPEYRRVNKDLLGELFFRLPQDFVMVDVASGTGLVEQIMTEFCERFKKRGKIIGVEPVNLALKKAKQNTPKSSYCEVDFVQGFGQNLVEVLGDRIPVGGVDATSINDAIHEINNEGKIRTYENIYEITKAGGWHAENSAFTTEGQGSSGRKYGVIVIGAHREMDVPIEKPAIETLEPLKYDELLESVGFKVMYHWKSHVLMSGDALDAIFEYPPFIQGSIPSIKTGDAMLLKRGSDALKHTRDKKGITDLDRLWYQILAQKK